MAKKAPIDSKLNLKEASITLHCTHLASVEGTAGMLTQVLFDPTPATIENIHKWLRSGKVLLITVHDRTGIHKIDRYLQALTWTGTAKCFIVHTL